MFQANWLTISKLWKEYRRQKGAGETSPDLHSKRKGYYGPKGINLSSLREARRHTPLKCRTTLRGLAWALAIPKSTLYNNLKKLGLRAVSRYLKPFLTYENKRARVRWALWWLRPSVGGGYKFHSFDDHVHLDEKWFPWSPDIIF